MEILGEVVVAFPECLWPSPPPFLLSIQIGDWEMTFLLFLPSWSDAERRTNGRLGRASVLKLGYLAEVLKMVFGGMLQSWRLPVHHPFPVLSFVVRVSIHSGGADQRR